MSVYDFLLHPQVTTQENENLLIINKLIATLRKIGAKKSIAIDRQIFPLFPVLIDIVTNLIVIYLFHFCTSLPRTTLFTVTKVQNK